MKWFVTLTLTVFICYGSVQAETVYVNDLMEITFRTGPGTDHKIIEILHSGQMLEVLQPEQDWTMVRLPSGRDGWVLNRFISASPPSSIVVKELKEKNLVLTSQAAVLLEENTQMKAANESLASELAKSREACSKISESYESLKKASADFFQLKQNYEQTAAQLAEKAQKVTQLENKLTKLQMNRNITWFIAGGGVLLFGFLIGFSAKRQRRRSSLL